MSRKDKITVMIYRAMELYLKLYPEERTRLKKLLSRPKNPERGSGRRETAHRRSV